MSKMVELAKLGTPHGVHGWLKLYSFTDPPENITHYSHLHIKRKSGWEPVTFTGIKPIKDCYLVKIEGFDQPETARQLTNCLIGVTEDQLPKLETHQHYWNDLIGLQVKNLQGIELGTVHSLFATGANDVLVVKDQNKQERLIPYIKDVIKSVDATNKQLIVDWEQDF